MKITVRRPYYAALPSTDSHRDERLVVDLNALSASPLTEQEQRDIMATRAKTATKRFVLSNYVA